MAFDFDVTDAVRKTENEVLIHAFDNTAGGLQALGKQSARPESWGCFHTPTTGIWQTVWLEGVGSTFIREFRVEADPANGRAVAQVTLDGQAAVGFCYTQLTDVEQEKNGLYYYDRRPKFDTGKLKAFVVREAAYEKTPRLEISKPEAMEWTLLLGKKRTD